MFQGSCAAEMSRRRVLLIWIICLTIVILIYYYLPYSVRTSENLANRLQSSNGDMFQGSRHIQGHENAYMTSIIKYFTRTTTEATTTTPTPVATTKTKICSPSDSFLVGVVYINKTAPEMQEVIEELSVDHGGFVEKGGAYRPKDCVAKNKLAIIVPYRNRSEHLRIFLRHMHPIMERQNHDYRIIVVEQAGNQSFNRAMLLNIGFLEALKITNFECFVFHDVDHILENDHNDYGCPEAPKLLGVSVEREKYKRRESPYRHYFGGVGAFTKEQFEKINGYSNIFWGWGGEDDDAYNRVQASGYTLLRSPANIGRYVMLTKNHIRAEAGPDRDVLLKTSAKRMYEDGLNSVRYKILKKTEYPLYTHLVVQLPKEVDMMPMNLTALMSSVSTPSAA